jgi:hypothetical protein
MGILIGLIVLGLNSVGCETKPDLKSPDGRPCIITFLTQPQATAIRGLVHKDVRWGDAIVTPDCLKEHALDLLNETYELTSEPISKP